MKAALIDTDIISEFLRGTTNVVDKADDYLKEYRPAFLSPGFAMPCFI